MKTSIIKIGNSKGLIIPKQMLNSLGINKKVNIEIKEGELHIFPVSDKTTRHEWEKQFTHAVKLGHVPDSMEHIENEFDKNEWTW